ncbi:MAG: hypothetical protein FWG21_03165 [Oscillospiraceae bacterium]|nr:hypothetical protein [Oscillospiraceae bacterium]
MNTRSKSSLFLIELVLVILVFSLSAAVCLRLFFESRLISNESRNISQASLAVQSVADVYKAMKGDYLKTAEFLGGSANDDSVDFYYNEIWEPVDNLADASFIIQLQEINEMHRESSVTASTLDGDPIFSVVVRGGLSFD